MQCIVDSGTPERFWRVTGIIVLWPSKAYVSATPGVGSVNFCTMDLGSALVLNWCKCMLCVLNAKEMDRVGARAPGGGGGLQVGRYRTGSNPVQSVQRSGATGGRLSGDADSPPPPRSNRDRRPPWEAILFQ